MNITDEMVDRAARVIHEEAYEISVVDGWEADTQWVRDRCLTIARAALEAALAEDDTEWEYSIAYRYEGDWEGADDLFADEKSARISLRDGGYRWNDQVVLRRKAGPWEPVEVSS